MKKLFVILTILLSINNIRVANAWKVTRSKFNPIMINRYKSMLQHKPDDNFAFRKLVHLYSVYSSLDKLILHYRNKKSPSYADLLILSKLYLKLLQLKQIPPLLNKAIRKSPKRYEAYKIYGEMYLKKREYTKSRKYLDKALKNIKNKKIKERLLKELVKLSILGGDPKTGAKYFSILLKNHPGSWSLRKDYADILVQALMYKKALIQYKKLLKMSYGDTRRKIIILKATGAVYESMGKDNKAKKIYWKAIRLTTKQHWIRRELINKIVSVARRQNTLPILVKHLRKKWRFPTAFQYFIMAKIYGEIGDFTMAFSFYKKAIYKNPQDVDLRLSYIDFLEKSGANPMKIIREYEALVASVPEQIRFAIELADKYFKLGRKVKARGIINKLLRKYPNDASLLLKLANIYNSWNKPDKVIKIYKKLIKIEPLDYEHYINLGQIYWSRGKRKKALNTWNLIIKKQGLFRTKSEAYYTLFKIYWDVKKYIFAKINITKALKKEPNNPVYIFAYAQILIKMKRLRTSEKYIIKALKLSQKKHNINLTNKIKKKLIDLWSEMHVLIFKLNKIYSSWNPSDIETGNFLAFGYIKSGNWKKAEQIYLKIKQQYPAMASPVLGLIRIYNQNVEYEKLIKILKEALKLMPDKKQRIYEQLSEVWSILGDEHKAKNYLQIALNLGATDSKSWIKVANLAIKLELYESAIKAYKQAIRLDPYEMKTYFDLARIYTRLSKPNKASEIYHQMILRTSEDEVLVKAANFAIEIDDLLHHLDKLEKLVYPLYFVYTHRSIFNEILIKIYERYIPWLIEKIKKSSSPSRKKYYNAQLNKIGKRALKPLLEAIANKKSHLHKIAEDLILKIENPASAYPIIRLAKQKWNQYMKKWNQPSTGSMRYSKIQNNLKYIKLAVYTAAKLRNPSTLKDLIFFANQTKDPQLALIAFWGIAGINTKHKLIIQSLLKPKTSNQLELACQVLAPYKKYRSDILSVVKNRKIQLQSRISCFKAWSLNGFDNKKDIQIFKTLKRFFIVPQMLHQWELLKYYVLKDINLSTLARNYWLSDGLKKIIIAKTILSELHLIKSDAKYKQIPYLYKVSELKHNPNTTTLLIKKISYVNSSSRVLNLLYGQTRYFSRLIRKSAFSYRKRYGNSFRDNEDSFQIVNPLPLLQNHKCKYSKQLENALLSSLKNLKNSSQNEFTQILNSFYQINLLKGFVYLCNKNFAQKLGTKIIKHSADFFDKKNKPNNVFNVKLKLNLLKIYQNPHYLIDFLSDRNLSDILKREILTELKLNNFQLSYSNYLKIRKNIPEKFKITILSIALQNRNNISTKQIISNLNYKHIPEVSLVLKYFQRNPHISPKIFLPFLQYVNSVYILKDLTKYLQKQYPETFTMFLKKLTPKRKKLILFLKN